MIKNLHLLAKLLGDGTEYPPENDKAMEARAHLLKKETESLNSALNTLYRQFYINLLKHREEENWLVNQI